MKKLFYIFVFGMLLCVSSAFAQAPQYITSWPAGPWPLGIDVDNQGRLWVSHYGNQSISCFTNTGGLIGNYQVPWVSPYGVGAGNNVYVGSDRFGVATNNGCIPIGEFCSFQDALTDCHGVALDDNENVYIATTGSWIYKFSPAGTQLAAYNLSGQDVAVDHVGNIFIMYDHHITKLTSDGVEVQRWDGTATPAGRLSAAEGIGLDRSGNVYVADTGNNRVVVFDTNGNYLVHWGTYGSGAGEFRQVEDVAVDDNGYIYVADAFNGRIQKFGYLPTPACKSTWGRVKSHYR